MLGIDTEHICRIAQFKYHILLIYSFNLLNFRFCGCILIEENGLFSNWCNLYSMENRWNNHELISWNLQTLFYFCFYLNQSKFHWICAVLCNQIFHYFWSKRVRNSFFSLLHYWVHLTHGYLQICWVDWECEHRSVLNSIKVKRPILVDTFSICTESCWNRA